MAKYDRMTQSVLLITVDSLRIDHLSADAGEETATTHLSEVNNEVTFSKAFATGPGTTPSFPALLSGTLPLSYGGLGPLTEERPRVSELLRNGEWTTGGFQCNPFLSTHFNYDRGYDKFEDYQNPLMGIATKIFPRGIEIRNPKLQRVDNVLHLTDIIKKTYQLIKGKPRPYVSADVITDDTISWLDETDRPFFCWTHYMDVHHPCHPPEQYRRQYDVADVTQSEVSDWYSALVSDPDQLTDTEIDKLRRLYDAAIDYTDDQISRIVEHLKETNRYEDTLIIVTSDHGELFGEHGQYGKPERMYDELLHVPLIVANGPDYLEDTQDQLVSLLDIPPLIHDALGLEVPDGYEGKIPGKDESRDLVMAEHEVEGDVIVGARSENWLYEGDEINDEHRLFDYSGDTPEQRSTDTDDPEAQTVKQAVLHRLNELDVETRRLEEEVEGDVESRLEDLGYL